MKTVFNNENIEIIREFEILKEINKSNLIKLEDEIFKLNDHPKIFCMITEYCEVNLLILEIIKVRLPS